MMVYTRIKLALIVLFALCSGMVLKAQIVQQGQVLLYRGEEAKTPLSGVSVSAQGAPAVMSDAEGRFTLSFRTLHSGDVIQFRRIGLVGYEVMNTEALDAARIANPDDPAAAAGPTVLTIVMCSTEELSKLRDGYRSVAAERYQKQYDEAQKQLEKLQQEGRIKEAEFNQRQEALELKYEAQLQTLDTYVDKFARIDLSELDDFERGIIALVKEGQFDEAIARYEEQNLTARLQQGVKEQQQLNRDVQTIQTAIDAKEVEATRLQRNIDKQNELRQKINNEITR